MSAAYGDYFVNEGERQPERTGGKGHYPFVLFVVLFCLAFIKYIYPFNAFFVEFPVALIASILLNIAHFIPLGSSIAGAEASVNSYFLVFLAFFALAGFAALGTMARVSGLFLRPVGQPTLVVGSIKSNISGAYTFVRPTFRISFIPRRLIWAFTVEKFIFFFSAISKTVNSFILFISVNIRENFNTVKYSKGFNYFVMRNLIKITSLYKLLYICVVIFEKIVKKNKNNLYKHLTIYRYRYILLI